MIYWANITGTAACLFDYLFLDQGRLCAACGGV